MLLNKSSLIIYLTTIALLACINPSFAKLKIVTGTTNIESITKAIVQDKAEVKSLLKGYQNPHHLTVRPGHLMALKSADLLIAAGLNMEPWLDGLIASSGNNNIRKNTRGYIDASQGVKALEIPSDIDRSLGDLHSSGNPHYTLDPLNTRIITKNIVDGIIIKDPTNADFYKQKRLEYINKVDTAMFGKKLVDEEGGNILYKLTIHGRLTNYLRSTNKTNDLSGWMGKMSPIKNLKVITYHKSWEYFAKRFHINVVDYIEPKPGIPPSGKHIKQTMENIKLQNIKYILMAPYFNKRVPEIIEKQTNAKVLVLPTETNGVKNTPDYISIFDNIIDQLTQ